MKRNPEPGNRPAPAARPFADGQGSDHDRRDVDESPVPDVTKNRSFPYGDVRRASRASFRNRRRVGAIHASILYVSKSRLLLPDGQSQVEALAAQARVWNRKVGITGALVLTDLKFVQFIEGPREAIDALLGKLAHDDRHSDMHIIERAESDRRTFGAWDLAYSGPDHFIDRELPPLLHPDPDDRGGGGIAANLLSRLRSMAEMA